VVNVIPSVISHFLILQTIFFKMMKPSFFFGGCDVVCDQGLFSHESIWLQIMVYKLFF
jgi:hypothetical protein